MVVLFGSLLLIEKLICFNSKLYFRHLKREAEPRDHELWSGNKPSLHQSTYDNLQKDIPSNVSLFNLKTIFQDFFVKSLKILRLSRLIPKHDASTKKPYDYWKREKIKTPQNI